MPGRWSAGTTRRRGRLSFNGRSLAFARCWGFRPRACAPYRARTKGKDERGVGYVKRNAIAGHRFESWAALEAHPGPRWTREVADVRVHGTTDEAPTARFERDEAAALSLARLRGAQSTTKPVAGRVPFRQLRELVRVVQSDACIELDTNRYSVPWRLIGATVTVLAGDEGIVVSHAGAEVARHEARRGRRERAIRPEQLDGIVGAGGVPRAVPVAPPPELLRPLAEYERLLGGAW